MQIIHRISPSNWWPNREIKQQYNIYLYAFINFEKNDWARLLPMDEFAYNNAKTPCTGYVPFKLNCGYHLRVSFQKTLILISNQKRLKNYPAN